MEHIGKILISTLSIFIIGAVLLSRANINVEKSMCIGDKLTDLAAANAAGIKKLFLLNFFNLKIPHLETSFFLTFFDAITDELYFLCNFIISREQFFFIIKSSGNNIKKYFDLINLRLFRSASPVPRGEF